jgi:hypothetical protein
MLFPRRTVDPYAIFFEAFVRWIVHNCPTGILREKALTNVSSLAIPLFRSWAPRGPNTL